MASTPFALRRVVALSVRRCPAVAAGALALAIAGCANVPNQWREDGPATRESLTTATADDVYARYKPAALHDRGWSPSEVPADRGAVIHWPQYLQDPFVDKGAGREGTNKYYIGWEDYVALAYSYPRFTLNWLALPVSMVVQPPWMLMESDGVVSRQALGYDHDAVPMGSESADAVPPAPGSPGTPTGGEGTGSGRGTAPGSGGSATATTAPVTSNGLIIQPASSTPTLVH